jgi:hypothetical protein
MKILARALLASLTVATACTNQANPDVSYQFRETPLRQLVGVEIGMPAQRLKASRPGVIFAPALGFKETVPDYSVSYEFKAAALDPDLTQVPSADPLRGIYMARLLPSDEAAVAAWREEVARIVAARRAPESCQQFPNGGREARWFSSKMSLAVGVFPPERNSAVVGSRVITALTTMEAMRRPAGGTPIPCPTS